LDASLHYTTICGEKEGRRGKKKRGMGKKKTGGVGTQSKQDPSLPAPMTYIFLNFFILLSLPEKERKKRKRERGGAEGEDVKH